MSGDFDALRDSTSSEDEQLVRLLEEKIRSLQIEIENLRKELNYYKSEMEKMLSPPLVEAVVLDILPDGRVLVRSSSGPNLIVNVARHIDLSKIKPGRSVALNQRGSTILDLLPEREDPIVKSMEVIEKPKVSYADIGGLGEQIKELREIVELPIKKPELFRELGIEPPKGVLLYGPPGTGKTLLAKAVASESNASFIHVVASEFAQKFVGEGARIVREVFEMARKKAPAIIFIDEIDAIGAKRLDIGTSGEREIQRTLMQLLAEIDGFNPLDNVKVIAATNRIDILDPALLRPGRFDRIIEVPLPDLRGRIEIFNIYLKKMKVSEDINIEILAKLTEGFSGADIKNVCIEAGYNAIRNDRNMILMNDLVEAINKINNKKVKVQNIQERREKYS
ncbi:proteasome-activating nucleotidase [Sulfolobus sp. A20]|uniref:proteasome-activating nucleotidase n=2 Tax=Sulfolobaceae TaxID=118883 RepID=UPI000845CFB8|nr:proteasome-activating nucleotidase [Sulfolobus sp. A20]TRM76555.1 proteasome-activating nucleotidase [Sulfolobus sp. B5]TRM77771.1 proteasome-activating nucleotidase [Sulfolobus sp. A20-N-F8]TRM81432.1 proteasome-activating nucleotidase [Sulfolobus sp. D5]TRM83918.1 proteasome-activating nucleotidase [Sulfolobus sp. A20-N-F6]TRM88715.1 proteasome-activating nucleotidase [Sulfolobus sp. C3]TRN00077.1 proteasome-activating nucleotidase [Sulfolobus sp. F1]TRN03105.1 proteasome-activating nuc